jgi:hypothetical protein
MVAVIFSTCEMQEPYMDDVVFEVYITQDQKSSRKPNDNTKTIGIIERLWG